MTLAVLAPTPGNSFNTRKPAIRSRGFAMNRSVASTSFTCAVSRNFRPPNFTNGMLRAGKLDLERSAVVGGPEQDRLTLQDDVFFSVFEDTLSTT